jgi:hypothetical protein
LLDFEARKDIGLIDKNPMPESTSFDMRTDEYFRGRRCIQNKMKCARKYLLFVILCYCQVVAAQSVHDKKSVKAIMDKETNIKYTTHGRILMTIGYVQRITLV